MRRRSSHCNIATQCGAFTTYQSGSRENTNQAGRAGVGRSRPTAHPRAATVDYDALCRNRRGPAVPVRIPGGRSILPATILTMPAFSHCGLIRRWALYCGCIRQKKHKGPWLAVKKNKLERLPVLDVQALYWQKLGAAYSTVGLAIHQEPLAPIAAVEDDPVRAQIDGAVTPGHWAFPLMAWRPSAFCSAPNHACNRQRNACGRTAGSQPVRNALPIRLASVS